MKIRIPVLFSVTALLLATLACGLFNTEMSLDNLRTAFDEDGNNQTTVFAPSDIFYAVADMRNAPAGTMVEAKWLLEQAEGYEPGEPYYEQSLTDFTDESFTGTIFFQLSNDVDWPIGDYRIELYLDGDFVQSTVFSVQ